MSDDTLKWVRSEVRQLRIENDRLRAEVERLKEENVALKKQLCNYQLSEIGSKLVEEMGNDE